MSKVVSSTAVFPAMMPLKLVHQLLMALGDAFLELSLFGLSLVQHKIEVGFADPPGNHVLVQPQHHLVQYLDPLFVLGEGVFQRFALGIAFGNTVVR